MKKTKLIIGAHHHTPFGSREEDFESAYNSFYKPFIATIYRFPSVPFVLHYSGVLLAWFEQRHPEFIMILEELVNRKQIELLGGGFYEPMMPIIPLSDRLGQIELLTTYLRKNFGKRPRGCWLPGLIWEQHLAGTLQTCGMDYSFLDSGQFIDARLSGPLSERPCYTEDQGKLVSIFPISIESNLAYALSEPAQFITNLIKPSSDGGDRIISIFPDYGTDHTEGGIGEKKRYFDEGRLCSFLNAIEASSDLIETTTPSRVLKSSAPFNKAFFPSSAERKVMHWAMGASPRQFLIRYPETNDIYAKMIFTHILINQLRGDKYRKRTAREQLWKAQGCDGFWHIGEGGVYLNNLRKSVYAAMIEAEKITREKGVFTASLVPMDFDLDGSREYLFQGADLNCYVRLAGGVVFELDYLPKAWNYLDTFARRHESYLSESSVVDGYRRSAFVDRLLDPAVTLNDASVCSYRNSRNCIHEHYDEVSIDRSHQNLSLRKPASWIGPYGAIEINKTYIVRKNVISVSYILKNTGIKPERFNFAVEIDLSLSGDEPGKQLVTSISSSSSSTVPLALGRLTDLDELRLEDLRLEVPISLTANAPFDAWILPIRTSCRVDGEILECYQSSCLMPVRSVVLTPGETWETQYFLHFGH